MIKKLLIAFTLLFLEHLSHAATKKASVEKYVDELVSSSVAILEDDKLSYKTKQQKIKATLKKNLDTNWMAKFTLGRKVKTLPKEDVEKFSSAYSEYLLATYTKGLKEYKGQKVEIKSYDDLGNGFYIVKTHVIGHTDQLIHVDYLTRNSGGTYTIRDIITEGISLVNSQRSEYTGVMENHGIDHLISELKKRSHDKTEERK